MCVCTHPALPSGKREREEAALYMFRTIHLIHQVRWIPPWQIQEMNGDSYPIVLQGLIAVLILGFEAAGTLVLVENVGSKLPAVSFGHFLRVSIV
jgi:hypothetical protein